MKDLKELYLTNSTMDFWKTRMKWTSLSGSTINGTSIFEFFRKLFNNKQELTDYFQVKNSLEFFDLVSKMCDTYVYFCEKNCKESGEFIKFTDEEKEDLAKTFKGHLGEYFFLKSVLSSAHTSFIIDGELVNWYNVAPANLYDDFGVDGFGIDNNNVPCVFQVKFWNPNYVKTMSIKVAQIAHSQGIGEELISQSDKKNVIICWLGNPIDTSKCFEKSYLKNLVRFIDRKTLDVALGKNSHFWSDVLIDDLDLIRTT